MGGACGVDMLVSLACLLGGGEEGVSQVGGRNGANGRAARTLLPRLLLL